MQELHRFKKNDLEEVKFEVGEYKGSEVLNIRTFVRGFDGQDIPTKKGLTFSLDLLPDFAEGLSKVITYTEKTSKPVTIGEGKENG